MVWWRLPIALPNFTLKLLPLSEAQQRIYKETGFLRELAFKAPPNVSKLEVKNFLESLYGLNVAKVNTANYQGRKKEGRAGPYRRGDYKKVFVHLTPPQAGTSHERREHVNSRGGRKSGGHVYCIKFFLIDSTGAEHLAAVGEDQGDAHYLYSNLPGFPGLFGHNKADVKRWLEEVQSRSQARAGYHLDVVTDPVPPEGSGPVALPSCVAYRQARRETPDGRHVVQWYLVDAVGGEHLAVAGEEKDTRDGHYEYRTQGIFESAAPLLAHNQTTVLKWLDSMVVHPAGGG
ncbi:hypothetical protein H632_c689p1, partial [Helicosporidium sp. ATCC 50920]